MLIDDALGTFRSQIALSIKSTRFWCLVILLWFTTAVPAETRVETPVRKWTTVNYRCLPNDVRPLISIALNNKVTATFLLDTGSYVSAISYTLVKKLGIVPKPYILAAGRPFMMDGKSLNKVDIAPLGIGEGKAQLSFTSYPLAVFAEKELVATTGPGVDGIIGTDLLRLMAVRLDCPQHQITFWYPGNLSPEELGGDGFDHSFIVPVTDPDNNALYYVNGQFQNGPALVSAKMRVDTGADATIVPVSVAQSLKLVPDTTQKANLFGNAMTVIQAKVPIIRFGDLTLLDHSVYYYEKDDNKAPLSLGMDVLSGYRVLLDYSHGSMYLKSALPVQIKVLGK